MQWQTVAGADFEAVFCWIRATRYDRLAANYLAFVQLASIRLWLRVNEIAS